MRLKKVAKDDLEKQEDEKKRRAEKQRNMNKANEEERKTLENKKRDEQVYEEERIKREKAEKETERARLLKEKTDQQAAEKERLLKVKVEEDAEKARIEKEKKDEEERIKRRKEELAVAKIKKEEEKPKLTLNNSLNSKPIKSDIQRDKAVEMKEKGKELDKKTVALKCKNESDTSDNPPKKIEVEDALKKMAFTFDDEGLPIWEEKEFPWDRIPPRPHGWDQHLWDMKCLRTFAEMRKAQYNALMASCQRKLER